MLPRAVPRVEQGDRGDGGRGAGRAGLEVAEDDAVAVALDGADGVCFPVGGGRSF